MTVVDHLLVILLVLVYPIVGRLTYRRVLRLIEQHGSPMRLKIYNRTMMQLTAIGLVVIFVWISNDRPWAELGLEAPWTLWQALVIAVVAAIFAYLLNLLGRTRRNAEIRDSLREVMAKIGPILPRSGQEIRRFTGVSLAAGIWEEVLFRGFLIWYLSAFMPLLAAAGLSVLAFGLAHSYQGVRGIFQTAAIGGVLTALYLLSGSLLAPMLLHFAMDAVNGRIGSVVMNEADADAALATQGAK